MASYVQALGVLCPVLAFALVVKRLQRRARVKALVHKAFKGKVVWVTGASSGIGRALSIAFAAKGAKLVLSARREAELLDVAEECAAAANGAFETDLNASAVAKVLPFDLCEPAAALLAKGKAAERLWGAPVDVLVNNGGISSRSPAEETSLDVDAKVMAIDYLAPVALAKAVLPSMLARRKGHLVVTTSVQGRLAIPFRTSYAAAKHALHGFFESLRAEVAGRGVRVTLVVPGYVRTSLSLNAVTGSGGAHGTMDANTAKGMDPAALAGAVLEAVAVGDDEVLACDLKTKLAVLARAVLPGPLASYMRSRAAKGWEELESSRTASS